MERKMLLTLKERAEQSFASEPKAMMSNPIDVRPATAPVAHAADPV
jgi:hypothetical protein